MSDRNRAIRRRTGRGQSEVLGFVLVFAVVITAIGLVTATGFGGLTNAQHVESANNAVRAFEILHDNVGELVAGRAPHRSTEVKLASQQLELGEPVAINVSLRPNGSTGPYVTTHLDTRPLEYVASPDSTLVYEGGALVRVDRGGQVMLRDPPFVVTDSSVILPLIETKPDDSVDGNGPASVGGSRTVSVRTHLTGDTAPIVSEAGEDVWINVTSPRAAAWGQYFQSLHRKYPDLVTATATSNTVASCKLENVSVTVVRDVIAVQFE